MKKSQLRRCRRPSVSSDTTTRLDGAVIQHGKLNNRVYLMDIGEADTHELIRQIDTLAKLHEYSKIFASVPITKAAAFLQSGYIAEAKIPKMYAGKTTGLFLCKYLHAERKDEPFAQHYRMITTLANSKASNRPADLPDGVEMVKCTVKDVKEMAALYGEVFSSYPFPIDDPAFLKEEITTGRTIFAGISEGGKLVSLAAAELAADADKLHAEMTDFATASEKRGSGHAYHLLGFLEQELGKIGIKTAYTIARAASIGMNVTFARQGYTLSGRLKNNTDIAGTIESMNVWYKHLD